MRYKINDPIHKIIPFGEREKGVMDHSFVQRLRSVKQLAFVSLVFPGAVHNRFSHSLGAMHIASLLAEQFFGDERYSVLARALTQKEKNFLSLMMRLSGLLHDVGHPPFSHAAEGHMPTLETLAIPKGWLPRNTGKRRATHEDYSVLLIWALSRGTHPVLSEEEAHIIASLIHKEMRIPSSWKKHFSPRINAQALHMLVRSWISGDVDIDRMDYLLRDSYFTGVPYGNHDISWLIKNLGVIERNGRYVTAISDTGVHAFEYYLFARYNMFTQVYFHKTVRCFEYYFQQALSHKEISYSISSDIHQYVSLRDTTFYESLMRHANIYPQSWSARLMGRKPSKRVVRMWGKKTKIDGIFKKIKADLDKIHLHPFLVFSKSKFLDYEEGVNVSRTKGIAKNKEAETSSLFSALSMTPLFVVRKQFGIRTAANIEDFSFILKHYHQDISIGDVFILPEEYEAGRLAIKKILRAYFTPSPSEIILDE